MILNTGDRWEPEDIDVIAWSKAYPVVDVFQELRAMESWLDANPTKRKTKRGIKSFVVRWLTKAQKQGGGLAVIGKQAVAAKLDPQGITSAPISIKSLTMDMELTDVTWLDPQESYMMKKYYLGQFGYYFDGVLKNA